MSYKFYRNEQYIINKSTLLNLLNNAHFESTQLNLQYVQKSVHLL